MTGEYGSGKSRCVREVFLELSQRSAETNVYPIAIDLKENWGLKRAQEIIRRHFDDLGLPNLANSILKSLNEKYFIFILDGFDELRFQSWSDDHEKLKNMRSLALEGVRDLIERTNGGIFICGREHYFKHNEELFSSLGIDRRDSVIILSKEEFSEQEMADYMSDISQEYQIPSWVPRRPLICQTIVSLPEDDLERMLGQLGGDLEFSHRFMDLLCKRDTRISKSLDAVTIYNVLLNLSSLNNSCGLASIA